MLLGTHRPTLDEKGRIVLPVVFRGQLQGDLFTVLGDDEQVSLMTFDDYSDRRVAKAAAAKNGPDGRRELYRFQEFASQLSIDGQGRVAIPENLRERCGIDRSAPLMVIGMTTWIDIWSSARYREFMEST